ncbi:carboxymuconolactone decarboxylase family protein [Kribbella sandramycini]|uniref:AhpD family alkylhydroperoxidase n=1 Tax=Kribbella sandramycini TaxID=60450 RepID=A0A7Y4KYC8_9ACTN|nr:carboxymuconolactone decarboxylase family protein [Kribbella sandramycini]MBB6569241.1 AhpD family alkylhydroperoxidase [Kribbella sandramycini]NOL40918.1 carboxymuconolactone decarboxylase family protein [Kribbella sandramycini]
MTERLTNPVAILPDAMKGIQNIFKAIHSSGASGTVLELVHLRASQINGCAPCVYGGIKSALKNGETDERLHQVVAWRDTDLFTDAERAALALTEEATRIADRPEAVADPTWAAAAEHFDERELSAIILMIGLTNMFNRINATTRAKAGATW